MQTTKGCRGKEETGWESASGKQWCKEIKSTHETDTAENTRREEETGLERDTEEKREDT